jgi:hypothetical protein
MENKIHPQILYKWAGWTTARLKGEIGKLTSLKRTPMFSTLAE